MASVVSRMSEATFEPEKRDVVEFFKKARSQASNQVR